VTSPPEGSRLSRPSAYAGGAIVAAAAFGVLALLVGAGHLDGVDSFAVRHLTPYRPAHESRTSLLGSLLSYHGHHFHAASVVKLPASALLSSVLVAVACLALWRRNRRKSALLWMSAFVLATVVELACKSAITKPPLHVLSHDDGLVRLTSLDSSFPSGHAVRGAVLAAVVAIAWPWLRPLVLAWLAGLMLILELYGIHTPSDIVGGLLLAGALILAVLALNRQSSTAEDSAFVPRRRRTRHSEQSDGPPPDVAGLTPPRDGAASTPANTGKWPGDRTIVRS
jgi:membrane-associated phospholipid phosphatase